MDVLDLGTSCTPLNRCGRWPNHVIGLERASRFRRLPYIYCAPGQRGTRLLPLAAYPPFIARRVSAGRDRLSPLTLLNRVVKETGLYLLGAFASLASLEAFGEHPHSSCRRHSPSVLSHIAPSEFEKRKRGTEWLREPGSASSVRSPA